MLRMSTAKVYLAPGTTDMRAGIDRLSMAVQGILDLDPFSGHLFVFCNRKRDAIKVLYWDRTGFCLWHKRLERHRFCWPEHVPEVMNITPQQLGWLLDGLTLTPQGAHQRLYYKSVL
jgi:transposase